MLSFKKGTIAITAAIFILSGCGDSSDSAATTTFRASIIHINDSHSNLDEQTLKITTDDNKSYDIKVGGMPRVVSKINELQKSMTNPITIHAGDALQGTMYYSIFKYEADAEMLNLIKWDSLTIGNHEFDDGDTNLANFISKLTTTKVVSANIEVPSTNILSGKFVPYVIKDIGGEKVGIIGLTVADKTKNSSFPSKEVVFKDEVESAQKYINELKSKGINKIIIASHIGFDKDLELAKKLSDVDVIVGGDSHTLLGDFKAIGLKSTDTYPKITTNKNGQMVCVVQAGDYAKVVGALEVGFDKDGVVTECKGTPKLLVGDTTIAYYEANGSKTILNADAKTAVLNKLKSIPTISITQPDTLAVSTLKKYSDQINTLKAREIGQAAEMLGHNRIPGDKYDKVNILPLGSDIAPIVAKSFYELSLRADACIQNAGGVRIAIEPGAITYGTAYTLLPFANTLYEINMKGSEIKQVLEDALVSAIDKKSTGSFPYAYGLRYDIDSTKPANSRVSNLEIKDRQSGTWKPIENEKMYVVVTNSFIAQGQDGYTTFKTVQDARGPGVDTYLDYAMSFVKYVENLTKDGKKLTKLPANEHPIKSYK